MRKLIVPVISLSVLLGACATVGPSSELVDARRAYDEARRSEAATFSPDKLLSAKQALTRAEAANADHPGSFEEKSLSYVAQRRAELASVYGFYQKDQRDTEQAKANYGGRQDQLRKQADKRADNAEGQLQASKQDLASEQGARKKAEQNMAAAMASLAKIAQVKEEARGTVITLDGSVLFVTGKSELLPIAREKLGEVAKALKDMDDDKSAQIEGYTDSRGADDANLKLSQDRADSVRQFLISNGVKTEKVRAVGKGEMNPVASNDTPEGRANNRRVEIVIQRQALASP